MLGEDLNQLRGTGKMEGCQSSSGTQSRGAMGFASIALTIDSSDHGLDMDADEVMIGPPVLPQRRGEYSISQNVTSRMYELLLDTGIGRDGYAIVGQGHIARSSAPNPPSTARSLRGLRHRQIPLPQKRGRAPSGAAEGSLERLLFCILSELERIGRSAGQRRPSSSFWA